MNIALKIFVCHIYLLFGCFLTAAEIDRSSSVATPQIQVKKKSNFLKKNPLERYNLSSAFNTQTGETLLVWKEFPFLGAPGLVTGKILSAKGKTTTKKFKPISPDCCFGLGVTFNPTNQEFLLVYLQNFAISGQRLNSKLTPIGNEFEIIPGTSQDHGNFNPSVVFNQSTGGYALAWERNDGIAIALLDSTGKLTGSIVPVKNNPEANGYYDDSGVYCCSPTRILGFEYLPSADKLLLLFQQSFSATQGDYWLATLNPTLQGFSSSSLTKINKKTVTFIRNSVGSYIFVNRWGASIAVTPDGSAFVYYGDQKSIKRRKIDPSGKPSGKAFPAFSGALNKAHLYDPRVTFSTISSGTTGLLTARLLDFPNPSPLYGQVIDSQGRPVGNPVLLDPSDIDSDCAQCNTANESELVALPRNPSDQLFRFAYFFIHQNHGPKQGTNPDDGTEILKIDLDVTP